MHKLKYFLFLLHIFVFKLSDHDTKERIKKDVDMIVKRKGWSSSFYMSLIKYLIESPYYRTFFYIRIGGKAKILRKFFPGDKYFFPIRNIGGGIYLAHPYSTILNAKSIGENFSCRQCTTIGNKIEGRNDLTPIIGDNVQLGANVVIIGNITIGDNVVIGAGSVVVKDIESNCIVAGNPARVIKYI